MCIYGLDTFCYQIFLGKMNPREVEKEKADEKKQEERRGRLRRRKDEKKSTKSNNECLGLDAEKYIAFCYGVLVRKPFLHAHALQKKLVSRNLIHGELRWERRMG